MTFDESASGHGTAGCMQDFGYGSSGPPSRHAELTLRAAFLLYAIAVVGFPVWYVVDETPDIRLWPLLLGGVGAALWLGVVSGRRLSRRGFARLVGVKIQPVTRRERLERNYRWKRDVVVLLIGGLIGFGFGLVTRLVA